MSDNSQIIEHSLSSINLPYSTKSVPGAIIAINDITNQYTINKAFSRLLTNDRFLARFFVEKLLNTSILVRAFDPEVTYDKTSRIVVNYTAPFSPLPEEKFTILRSTKDKNKTVPSAENIANYDTPTSELANYDWVIDSFSLSSPNIQSEYLDNYLRQIPLEKQTTTPLSASIKNNILEHSSTSDDKDYVIKTLYSKTPIILYASTTTWGDGVKLNPNTTVSSIAYSWYRLYKSGYVECGGITRPFSLTEQWNGDFGKSLVEIQFPIAINCLNATYTLMGNNNNFTTLYDSKGFSTQALAMYQITEGRQSTKNYVYNLKEAPDANPGNNIQHISNTALTIQINHETYNIDSGDIGKTDAALTKISWMATGVAV